MSSLKLVKSLRKIEWNRLSRGSRRCFPEILLHGCGSKFQRARLGGACENLVLDSRRLLRVYHRNYAAQLGLCLWREKFLEVGVDASKLVGYVGGGLGNLKK